MSDVLAASPLVLLLCGALLLLLVDKFSFWIGSATFLAALFAAYFAPASTHPLLTPWLVFDGASRGFTCAFLTIGLACSWLAAPFFRRLSSLPEAEFYFFLIAATSGLILIGMSADFLTLFLGVETLSLSLYVLCAYVKGWTRSSEASIKYFFMGSLGAAFLLYGIALLYGAMGTTRFDELAAKVPLLAGADLALFWGGIAFITLALAFEAAIVPFQVWAPDVYEGASNPVTAFMAVGTKVGAFAAFYRVFLFSLPKFNLLWNEGVALLAFLTLIWANFVAMRQTQLRRFFAYSGIAHAGFLLLPLVAGTPDAFEALFFYLVVYALATLACFSILSFLDTSEAGVQLQDLSGLFWRSPFLATTLAFALLTLAGIPPTIGFFAKLYVLKTAFAAGYRALVITALLTSLLAAYYYLRFVVALFSNVGDKEPLSYPWTSLILSIGALALLVVLWLFPGSVF